MQRTYVQRMIYISLSAALIVVCAQVIIPLPLSLVPITLATFGVMITGLLLGSKDGLLAVLVYLLLGLVGVPVFAGLKGGIQTLVGPTGGYLIGYVPYVIFSGLPLSRWQNSFIRRCLLMLLGTFVCYLLGTVWFMVATNRSLPESLSMCVLPFLPGDAAKILLSSFLAPRIRKALDLRVL